MDGKKRNLTEAQNILQLYSGVGNKPFDIPIKDENDEKKNDNKKEEGNEKKNDDIETKRPQRRDRIKLDKLLDKTPEISKKTFTLDKNENKDQENHENEEEEDHIEEEQYVQNEGYIYKLSHSKKK